MYFRSIHIVKTLLNIDLLTKSTKIKHFHTFRTLSSGFSSKQHIQPCISSSDEFRTENNLIFPADPDTFGTLSGRRLQKLPVDEGDLREEEYTENIPLRSQKLSTKQYADIIKEYVKHKRIKEALDVLEIKMIKEDRVRPENYIYNILIGACADVGYTKKAFKLYNDMKRRALKITGDTYTCLFNACANSPWQADGLKNAKHLRELMKEKGIEPNLTNYNSMIKAFGRCGDLSTAFEIVDEMVSKKIKIRVHTFNFLLQACITDKANGLRHAIIVWRKMLLRREKPNIYSFNLMLKCVKECNFGTKEDIFEAVSIISTNTNIDRKVKSEPLQLEPTLKNISIITENTTKLDGESHDKLDTKDYDNVQIELINENEKSIACSKIKPVENLVPNLLSKDLLIDEVISIKEVKTPQDKFEFIGGQTGFLQEMKVYNVSPDFKTMAQMVLLIPNTQEAESKLLETVREHNIWVDIEFYNTLIRKRCMRFDYEGALAVKNLIEEENKYRKKKHPMRKRLHLKYNLLTYGALAMTCETKEGAEKMISEIEEAGIKVNIEILGAMLSQAKARLDLDYAVFIMEHVKSLGLKPNQVFLNHLLNINSKGLHMRRLFQTGANPGNWTEENVKKYAKFRKYHVKWVKEIAEFDSSRMKPDGFNIEMEPEHPWSQFMENQPETVQRQNLIKPQKRYFKRKKHPKAYKPF